MSPLEDPVSRCVVRIGPDGDGYDRRSSRFWGSGFFIAPEWVLTCAHVVVGREAEVTGNEQPKRVRITTDEGRVLTGEVVRVMAGADLALVRVPEARSADCLWLSDRSDCTPAEVGLYGWAQAQDGGADFLAPTGLATGGRRGNPMTLQSAVVLHGCSGGPVVDARHGAVIGVVKSKAQGDATVGRASPTTWLRALCDEPGSDDARLWHEVIAAHDRHHMDRYARAGDSWPRLQTRLAAQQRRPHLFAPDMRARLYGLFAAVAPPSGAGQVLHLVNEARRLVLRGPRRLDADAPSDWRDGTGLLYDPRDATEASESQGRDLELEAVVLYAAMVHAAVGTPGDPDAAALRDWVEATAHRLRNDVIRESVPGLLTTGAQGGQEAHDDVLVVIGPELYGTYRWQVRLVGADGRTTTLRNDDEGATREELESSLREALAAAVVGADVGEHLAAVDFLLPRALFDEPVDEWRLRLPRPGEPPSVHTLPIGRRRVVALRDQLRRHDGATPEWRRGWTALEQGPLSARPLCADVPASGHRALTPESEEAAYTRLLDGPSGTVPVYCASTAHGRGSAVLTRAFHAGHAAVICRRTGDADHDDCADFHERAARLVHEAGTGRALRERIRLLRNMSAAAELPDHDAAWARHIVLIYDPPDRQALHSVSPGPPGGVPHDPPPGVPPDPPP